jgi:hypothetical protein
MAPVRDAVILSGGEVAAGGAFEGDVGVSPSYFGGRFH